MRGTLTILLGCSALALSSGAAAQAGGSGEERTLQIDPLISQVRAFEAEAKAARSLADEKKAARERTAKFLDELKVRQDRAGITSAEAATAVAALRSQLQREIAEEGSAEEQAVWLEDKAKDARIAIIGVSPQLSPPKVDTDRAPPANPLRDADADRAFGTTTEEILNKPNAFLYGFAQAEKEKSPETGGRTAFQSARRVAAGVGALLFDRDIDRRTSGASLDMGSEDSRLSLSLAANRAGKIIATDESESPYLNTYSVSLSAKEEDSFGQLFTGGKKGGFGGDLELSISVNKTLFRRRSRQEAANAIAAAERGFRFDPGKDAVGANLESECRKDRHTGSPGISEDELAAKCTGTELRNWVIKKEAGKYAHPKAQEALAAAVWGQTLPEVDVGFGLSIGRQQFGYKILTGTDPADLDAADLLFGRKEHKFTGHPWKVSAHLGGYLYEYMVSGVEPNRLEEPTPWLYGALIAEAGREWKFPEGTEDQVVCAPSAATVGTFTRCETVDIGRPLRGRFLRLGTQGRIGLPGIGLIPRIGISPKVTYDVWDNQWAFDIPVSFVEDSEGKLKAGVRFKRKSGGTNPEAWSVGLFLGTAFDVNP